MYALLLFASSLCFLFVDAQKVPVTVYYESLCPDSKQFFKTQLYPTLQTNLSKWINLTLVPYGKSNQTQLPGDQWQFTCHHGPYECQGNKIQACALQEIEKTTPKSAESGFNPVTLAFINCLMDKVEKTRKNGIDEYMFPVGNCSEINHVMNYANIENCAKHTTGNEYLVELGLKTNAFQEPLKSVPTIVFNGKYKADDSKEAQVNLVKTLCRYITENKPEECNGCIVNTVTAVLFAAMVLVKHIL